MGSIPADHAFTQFQSGSRRNLPVRQERRLVIRCTGKIHSLTLPPVTIHLQHFLGSDQQSRQHHAPSHDGLPERQESARYGHRIYVRTQLPGSPGDGFIVYMARQEAKRSSERHEQNRKDRCLPSPRCPLDRLLDRANTGRRTDPAT